MRSKSCWGSAMPKPKLKTSTDEESLSSELQNSETPEMTEIPESLEIPETPEQAEHESFEEFSVASDFIEEEILQASDEPALEEDFMEGGAIEETEENFVETNA